MTDPHSVLRLRAIRSFHIGGSVRHLQGLPLETLRLAQNGAARSIDPNGDHVSGQMYVQAYLQAEPRHRLPVLLWHGGGMTGANWETTPDGRPGWLTFFLQAGFDVYVSDAVERGRSSWSRWPEIYASAPVFRSLEDGWDMFRIGPSGSYRSRPDERVPFADHQFPVQAFDHFAAQWVPRWIGHEEMTLRAYDALLERVGDCIVIGHSQGGGFALEAVRRRPGRVKAVAVIEPSGAPSVDSVDAGVPVGGRFPPHLVVWGDHIAGHPTWVGYRQTVDRYMHGLQGVGVAASTLDLPHSGIRGNSHFPMLDRNSDQVAARVAGWLASVTQD